MPETLPNPVKQTLRARAQRLAPMLRLGHGGASEAFLKSLDQALGMHELVKIKFMEFKDEKKILAPEIAEKSGSTLIMRVGNVAVYYRSKADRLMPVADGIAE